MRIEEKIVLLKLSSQIIFMSIVLFGSNPLTDLIFAGMLILMYTAEIFKTL